jgi:F-type H+-transporting ATPase subunit delta
VVNGLLDEDRVRAAARRMLAARTRDARTGLIHFLRLVRLDLARHSVKIESVVPLALELRSELKAGLTRRFGPGLSTTFAQRPELIGGLRIQVGCNVYDDTVLARLNALEKGF